MQTSEWAAKQPHKIIFKFKSGSRFESDPKSNRPGDPEIPNRPLIADAGGSVSLRAASCLRSPADASLIAPAEKCNHRLREIFPSLQIVGDPNILLGKSLAREVRDVELATIGQFGVLPCLFPIVLCSPRPGFHISAPQLTPNEY
jgi:hypothetical protein